MISSLDIIFFLLCLGPHVMYIFCVFFVVHYDPHIDVHAAVMSIFLLYLLKHQFSPLYCSFGSGYPTKCMKVPCDGCIWGILLIQKKHYVTIYDVKYVTNSGYNRFEDNGFITSKCNFYLTTRHFYLANPFCLMFIATGVPCLFQVTSKHYSIAVLKDHYKFNRLENYLVRYFQHFHGNTVSDFFWDDDAYKHAYAFAMPSAAKLLITMWHLTTGTRFCQIWLRLRT